MVNKKNNGVRLELNDHSEGFDASRVFERIDRKFISNISTDEKSMDVEFSCDCTAEVFSEGPRMVVLDVSAASGLNTIEPNSSELAFLGQSALRFNRAEEPRAAIKPAELPSIPAIAVEETSFPRLENSFRSLSAPELNTALEPDDLFQAQIELSQQIGAAATRGLLTPTEQRFDLDTVPPQPQIDTGIFDSTERDQIRSTLRGEPRDNIKITRSSDASQILNGQLQNFTSGATSCISPELIDIQSWGTEAGLSAELARLRGLLFGEFDRLDYKIVVQLAKMYLHYGFGAEARQILLLDSALVQAHPELISISNIMEYGHDQPSSYLEQFAGCESSAALWSILSTPEIDPNTTINTKAALLTLSGLALHLRNFIAPELSRRFLTYGDQNAATAALRSLERGSDSLSSNANFVKANLEMIHGDTKRAQQRLSEVVTSNTEQSAEALIEYVNWHLDQDTEIEEQVATLVQAYAMEMRDSVIGDELARTHVLALGKSGQFSAAFAALSRVRERNTDAKESTLRSSILDVLARDASDAEFLNHTFAQLDIEPEMLTASTRFHLAKRLVKLGFYKHGEAILRIEPKYPTGSKKRLLEAQISLALSRPHEALAHLFGETSEAAQNLRAQAEIDVGDYAQAHSTYNAIGDEKNSRRSAWLSDDWSELVEEAAPVYGPVVSVSKSTVENPSKIEGMLGRATSAISESQQARQIIQDLLNSSETRISEN